MTFKCKEMVEWYFGDLVAARLPALAKAPAKVQATSKNTVDFVDHQKPWQLK
jgi:hypothetical protein